MLLKKIRNIILDNRRLHRASLLQSKELEWAHIYHDSIRGVNWLENLPLNIGRWAGNYTFFYILNRILMDFKTKSILEFGLGESTKFITSHLKNNLLDTQHLVIEQDNNWKNFYSKKNKLSKNTKIEVVPIGIKNINGFKVKTYTDIEKVVVNKFDFYIIDGPFGSPRFSRYDIVTLANKLSQDDEFIILIDDYNREGEKDTTDELLTILRGNNIEIHFSMYTGNKSIAILATKKYKYATTL